MSYVSYLSLAVLIIKKLTISAIILSVNQLTVDITPRNKQALSVTY